MKIGELETKLGLSRHTIRYYEKEGFIHPKRSDNDYRDYSDEDVQILKIVKFLRNLNISIDDVKAVLDGRLDFHECLKINQIHLENQIEQMNDLKKTIDSYEDKNIPLIPILNTIKNEKENWKLGIHKTTNTVSLGRKLTKPWAIRQMIYAGLSSLIISLLIVRWINSFMTSFSWIVNIGICIILFVLCEMIMIAGAFRETTPMMLDNSMDQSIEFLENTIRYYKFAGFIRNLKYFISVLIGKDKKYMKEYSYSDIQEVEIIAKRRYMSVMAPIAIDVIVADFHFKFYDGQSFYFCWPMILDDDAKYLSLILQNKVSNIKDKYHILYAMENGINLTDYLKSASIDF